MEDESRQWKGNLPIYMYLVALVVMAAVALRPGIFWGVWGSPSY